MDGSICDTILEITQHLSQLHCLFSWGDIKEELKSLLIKVKEESEKVGLKLRRSNQSILKEISPGCSLEGLMLRLKL